uniref:Homeobox domain-containing protein n=1 Tax=Araucaria cunninghamii TaxID=56994 RepID=A0A0D6QVK8_ARACU
MGNSPTAPHDVSSNLFASRIGGHPYNVWQNGGNELTFMQTADAAGSNQSLSGQLNSSGSLGHQSVAEISQLGVRRAPTSSIQEQQSGMLPSGLSLQLEQSHGSTGHGQGLSLSLSPQQPPAVQLSSFQNQATDSDINCPGISATSEENMSRTDRSTNKWPGSLTPFRASSRDGMLGASFSSPGFSSTHYGAGANKQMHLDSTSSGAPGLPNALMGSKYLKAAQQLLEEVVNVGKGIKPDSAKQQKSQSWIGAMVNKENSGTEASGKDGASAASTWPSTSAQEKNERISELSSAERQELQMKKAKLVAMLDEVDHRYRQYYHQMQIVVASFEAAAGIGAAKTYTALALQTISRHFRCLRDAISGQIRMTSKSLGEEDSTASGKGETSRLRFVDQHLRQQRALQQLGMIQQHAWRPQRGLPERSVSVLRAWLFEHFLHPYPKDNDKVMLARQTGLTRSQVSNWFINARVRLWKPMVEEMYMEEMKDSDPERASNEKMSKESGEKKDEATSKAGSTGNNGHGSEQKLANSTKFDSSTQDGSNDHKSAGALKSDNASNLMSVRNQSFGINGTSEGQVFHEIENEGIRHGQLKKPRTGTQESASLLSPNMSIDVDLKSEETNSGEFCDNNKFTDDRQNTEDYSLVHNAMVHPDNAGTFGSYQLENLSRYGQEPFTPRFSGSSGVSLTLGLQHTDGLSLSGTQQSYMSSQSLAPGRRHDLGNDSSDYCNIETSGGHPASTYENMQNRKRFAAAQLMRDFVA